MPLSAEMIALLTRHEAGTVERAMRAFIQLGLVEVMEDNTYYMPEIQEMTGKGSSDGERKARYRRQKVEENTPLHVDKNGGMGQKWDNVPPVSQSCSPEIRDKSIENRDKNLDKTCLCRCKSDELEKEEQERKDRELMEGISRLKSAGLQDSTFFGYTFANCDGTHPCAGYGHRYVENFAEFQKKGQGLLFWGNVGTGKTFLAGCIANALMEKNIPVLMTSFPKLLNALGGVFSSEKNEYLKSLNRYQLLIIDDLGVERDTPYVLETVYLVIDERYKSGKPFIITTNRSLEELQNPADLEHGRIYDRIVERCIPVSFSGKNYRTDKGRANMESASGILRR